MCKKYTYIIWHSWRHIRSLILGNAVHVRLLLIVSHLFSVIAIIHIFVQLRFHIQIIVSITERIIFLIFHILISIVWLRLFIIPSVCWERNARSTSIISVPIITFFICVRITIVVVVIIIIIVVLVTITVVWVLVVLLVTVLPADSTCYTLHKKNNLLVTLEFFSLNENLQSVRLI